MNVIQLKTIETPVGNMTACATRDGICLFDFSDRTSLENEIKSVADFFKAEIRSESNPHFDVLEKELEEYFSGKRCSFSVPIQRTGTPFQNKVWNILLEIPYGQTITYGEQAVLAGNSKSVRAVARANGMNKFPILIPCHRVIGAKGILTGYSGGIWRKKFLLDLEQRTH